MKNRIYLLIFSLIIVVIYACSKNDVTDGNSNNNDAGANAKNFKIGDISLSLHSNKLVSAFQSENISLSYEVKKANNGIIESSLKIHDNNRNSDATISFTVDKSQTAYKLIQHEKVIDEAKKAFPDFKLFTLETIVKTYEKFGKSLAQDKSLQQSPEFIESLFFHNAILNTMNRMQRQPDDCGCTPYPAYFVGKSDFWCQEDYYINPSAIVKKAELLSFKLGEREMAEYKFLVANKHLSSISIDKLTSVTITKERFTDNVKGFYIKATTDDSNTRTKVIDCTECFWGICGNQLGCCGNYSGCCWLATWDCFVHDVDCLNCDHWHCGPACTPGTGG